MHHKNLNSNNVPTVHPHNFVKELNKLAKNNLSHQSIKYNYG